MHVMWWMPSKRMAQVPFAEILACSNTSTEGARPAADAHAPLPVRWASCAGGSGPARSRRTPVCASTVQPAISTAFRRPRAVEDEPLAAVAARVEPGERRAEERERRAHRVEQEQVPAADAPDRLERADRVGDHLQDEAHDDDVVLALEVEDAPRLVGDARAAQLAGELEPLAAPCDWKATARRSPRPRPRRGARARTPRSRRRCRRRGSACPSRRATEARPSSAADPSRPACSRRPAGRSRATSRVV